MSTQPRLCRARVISQRMDRHEWLGGKTSRLTPDVQVPQTPSAFHPRAQRNAFRRRDAQQVESGPPIHPERACCVNFVPTN
jgi:hypothetical protein